MPHSSFHCSSTTRRAAGKERRERATTAGTPEATAEPNLHPKHRGAAEREAREAAEGTGGDTERGRGIETGGQDQDDLGNVLNVIITTVGWPG